MECVMKKVKRILIIAVLLAVAAGIIAGVYAFRNWPIRFRSELDRFFGEGNWESISNETKESLIHEEYVSFRSHPEFSRDVPMKYKDWDIEFTNRNGEQEIWEITDYTLRVNRDKYWLLSPNRYSTKQAFVQQLMDISFGMAGEEVYRNVVREILPENEAQCLRVSISYRGGNPEPDVYDELWEQSWFTANKVTAKDFVETDVYDFYIDVFAYDYRVEKLTDSEREHMMDSYEELKHALESEYGDESAFEIYFDGEHCTEEYGGE